MISLIINDFPPLLFERSIIVESRAIVLMSNSRIINVSGTSTLPAINFYICIVYLEINEDKTIKSLFSMISWYLSYVCYIVCSLMDKLKIFSSSKLYFKDYCLVIEDMVIHEKRLPKKLAIDFDRILADKVTVGISLFGVHVVIEQLKVDLIIQKKNLCSDGIEESIVEYGEINKEIKTLIELVETFIYNSDVQLKNTQVECQGATLSIRDIFLKNKILNISDITIQDKFQVLSIPSTTIAYEKELLVFTGEDSTISIKLDKSITDKLSSVYEVISLNKANRKTLINISSLTESLTSTSGFSPYEMKEEKDKLGIRVLFKGYHVKLDWYKDFSKFGLKSSHLSFFFENVSVLTDKQATLLGIGKLSTTVGHTSRIDIKLSSKRELVISVDQITSETSKSTINNISKLFKSTEQDFEVIQPSFYFSKVVFSSVNIRVLYINEKANVQKLIKGHIFELLKFIPPHDLEFNFPQVYLGKTSDVEGVLFGWLKVIWKTKKTYILGKLGKMASKGKRTFT